MASHRNQTGMRMSGERTDTSYSSIHVMNFLLDIMVIIVRERRGQGRLNSTPSATEPTHIEADILM